MSFLDDNYMYMFKNYNEAVALKAVAVKACMRTT